jgi:hypothetical protein
MVSEPPGGCEEAHVRRASAQCESHCLRLVGHTTTGSFNIDRRNIEQRVKNLPALTSVYVDKMLVKVQAVKDQVPQHTPVGVDIVLGKTLTDPPLEEWE